jgi:DNA-binding XRE family transcriptional regulator
MNKIPKEERKMIQQEYANKLAGYLPVLRAAANLTQNQLAKRLDVTRPTIMNIETKKRPLQFHLYLAMVLVFMQNEDSKKLLESFNLYDEEFLQKIL